MRFREAHSNDSDALCAISLATGFAGADASHLYKDGTLIGLIYSAPYACLEPDLALIVEDDEGVAGFAVGVIDTCEWEARLEREWWPRLRNIYPCPDGPPSDWTADQRRSAMIHSTEHTPQSVSDDYPGHLHLNLLPRIQGQGVGSTLLGKWLMLAQDRGAAAVHVGVNHENRRGLGFWAHSGFHPLSVDGGSPRTIWMGRSLSFA
jgi:GNAT superfamily N-acetyltransferase